MVKSITKKSEDISGWYNDVVEKAGLAEHGPVRGTMILRPLGYSLWETVQRLMNIKIKDFGVENVYFPLFIPYSFFEKEKQHVEGFSPELAIVTHGGGQKLSEPVVVRPTSETIMYDAFSRWIQSYKDLPLKVNQWNNVVRWEKRPYYFLRTTEFLWQEGHTAHATGEEAQEMVEQALKMYVEFYRDVVGIWGYVGVKSESEKFAGAQKTFTYEMLMPDGKVIQGCTSHNLGQNFAKVFNVKYLSSEGKEELVYQTSWGYSTRCIGALILAHGDDNGLVLPPLMAPIQVVILPIVTKNSDNKSVLDLSKKVFEILESHNINVKLDNSDQSVGWKFNQYDLTGVPIRIEIGGREAETGELTVKLRNQDERHTIGIKILTETIEKLLNGMQHRLLETSEKFTKENTFSVKSYEEFKEIMEGKRGFLEAFWCESKDCEEKIKAETKASTRCLPLGSVEEKGKCVYCGKEANHRWLFGQSY